MVLDGWTREFQNGSIFDASRNTYELMTQTAEYRLCGCRINPHDAFERRLRFMLRASVKSVFSRGFDVGSIV